MRVSRSAETLSSSELSEQLEQLDITVTAVTTPAVRYTRETRVSCKNGTRTCCFLIIRQMHRDCSAAPRCVIRGETRAIFYAANVRA